VLPPSLRARVSVEAAVGQGWREVVGDAGRIISLEHFGASADYKTIFREFGITAEAVVEAARQTIADARGDDVRPGGVQQTSAPSTAGTGDLPA
jgi:transketolase